MLSWTIVDRIVGELVGKVGNDGNSCNFKCLRLPARQKWNACTRSTPMLRLGRSPSSECRVKGVDERAAAYNSRPGATWCEQRYVYIHISLCVHMTKDVWALMHSNKPREWGKYWVRMSRRVHSKFESSNVSLYLKSPKTITSSVFGVKSTLRCIVHSSKHEL